MLTADFSKFSLGRGTLALDAGCGTGRHACELYRTTDVKVVGIDMNWQDLKKTAMTLYLIDEEGKKNSGQWMASRSDITNLPFEDNIFDLVICSEVLEHVPDNRKAVSELVRVLKQGKDIVVSVPRFFPERVCWALSSEYHNEPGGHIRVYRKKEVLKMLENEGLKCRGIKYRHGLHAPYWWLKCFVGHTRQDSRAVNAYRKFLEWDIMHHPPCIRGLEKLINPLIAKSIVFYMKKGM
ncbi:MAG: class I SAM-dependent methyltransferase [Syntrophales bacterium]|jgi:SAM-dependent methyltransferase|nr:class I SAM-dependent methyltransferase [Syntrophales bacterium]MDY0043995.1 class I SAM-dependent methyltransferase [Syntrophales bacterium]